MHACLCLSRRRKHFIRLVHRINNSAISNYVISVDRLILMCLNYCSVVQYQQICCRCIHRWQKQSVECSLIVLLINFMSHIWNLVHFAEKGICFSSSLEIVYPNFMAVTFYGCIYLKPGFIFNAFLVLVTT